MIRFFIDFLRYYTQDERTGNLTTSQFMSIIAAIAAVAFMVFLTKRRTSDIHKAAEDLS